MRNLKPPFALAALLAAPYQALSYCPGADPYSNTFAADYYSEASELARSSYAVEGTVVGASWVDEHGLLHTSSPPLGDDGRTIGISAPYLGVWYELKTDISRKGDAVGIVRVFSENSTGRFPMDVGRRYFLYLSEEDFGPPVGKALVADNCGNSAPVQTDVEKSLSLISRLLHQLGDKAAFATRKSLNP